MKITGLSVKHFAMAVAVVGISLASSTHALAGVIPGSSFEVDIVGFPSLTGGSGYYLVDPLTATFGTTDTFTGAGLGGQTVTVTSSQVVGANTTTDTITISVPTNFDPVGTSPAMKDLQFDVGYLNGSQPLTLSPAIDPSTVVLSGSLGYIGGTFALTPTAGFSNGDQDLSLAEGVNEGGANTDNLDAKSFSITATYANPVAATPEPGSLVLLGSGMGLTALLAMRRRKALISGTAA